MRKESTVIMKWFAKVRLGSWASDATATAERVMPWLDSLAQVSPLLADWKLLGKSRYECLVARPLTLDTLRVRLWEGRSKVIFPGRTIPGYRASPAFAGDIDEGPVILRIDAGIYIGTDHPGINMLDIKFGALEVEELEGLADPLIDATVGTFDPVYLSLCDLDVSVDREWDMFLPGWKIYLPHTASPARAQQAQQAATTTRHLQPGTVYTIATPTTYPPHTTDWTKDPKPDTDPDA